MTPLKLALAAGAAALAMPFPAHAQMNMNMPGMSMPGMKMPMPKKKPATTKKKVAAKESIAKKTAAKKAPAAKTSAAKAAKKPGATKAKPKQSSHEMSSMPGMDMGGHDMSSMSGMKMPEGQTMPGMTMPSTPPAGRQDMSNMPGMSMPGHDMSSMPSMAMPTNSDAEAAGTNLPPGSAPAPPVPTDHAADQVYGQDAMAMGRHHLQSFHGGQKLFQLSNNIMEYQARKGRDGYEWNSEAWYGGDINRLWIKSEGEGAFGGKLERAEVQGLYSRAIDPYFNIQGGVRYDFRPNPSRVYATIGIEGLAPSFFEVEGALFLSNKGELMARGEAWYDQRITQRLILQPRVEFNLAAQNSRSIGVGAGLSDAELGLRLRYDLRREFSPYVGVQYNRAFGASRRFRLAEGENEGAWEFVAGVRTWF